ncbi:brachyurin-like [Bradysia coprophila]|uniref:brachyurin-like n=1 Tax=Bradysia coprophila TaxID=38358 RepID=UPI00187D83FB|nr:brachyurin-like [Bradysia coprophila]
MNGVTLIFFLFAPVFGSIVEVEDIDWDTVKPIQYYPKFWDDKPTANRPSEQFFDQQRNGMNRIVGGQIAQPHQFPYQAAVLMFLPSIGGTALCGGSLVSQQSILTAAHCVFGATSGTIVLGAHFLANANEPNQRRITIAPESIIMHPSFNPQSSRDDIALVRLPAPIQFIPGIIQPVALPTAAHGGQNFAGYSGLVSGWGVFSDSQGVESDVLRFVYDNIMTNVACSLFFPGLIHNTMICMSGTNGRGACSGDSGGPMTTRTAGGQTLLVGVVSFGFTPRCELSVPSIFTRTTSYINWLQANII